MTKRPDTRRELMEVLPPGASIGIDRSDHSRDFIAALARARDHAEAVRAVAAEEVRAAELELTRVVAETWTLGASWRSIGRVLGISRQAAAQRYGQAARDEYDRRHGMLPE